MLYALIGATDAKLPGYEQEHMDLEFRDLEEKQPSRSRVYCSSGSGSGTKSDVRRWGFAGEDAGGRVRQGRARTRAAGAGA